MISAAHDVADRHKGKGEHFAHEVGADLPRLDEIGFFALAEKIVAFIFVISAHTGDDYVGRDFFGACPAFVHRFRPRQLGKV